jgi:hypothetical protein
MQRDDVVKYWIETSKGHIEKIKEFRQWLIKKIEK